MMCKSAAHLVRLSRTEPVNVGIFAHVVFISRISMLQMETM